MQHRLATLMTLSTAALFAGCEGRNLVDRLSNVASYGICSAVVAIVDVVFLFEVARSDRGLLGKVLWGLFIVFAPCLGCAIYFFFARRPRS